MAAMSPGSVLLPRLLGRLPSHSHTALRTLSSVRVLGIQAILAVTVLIWMSKTSSYTGGVRNF